MRDSTDNPFSPGSDTVPEIWAGRLAQINDWRDVLRPRLLRGLPERGRTILGEPAEEPGADHVAPVAELLGAAGPDLRDRVGSGAEGVVRRVAHVGNVTKPREAW